MKESRRSKRTRPRRIQRGGYSCTDLYERKDKFNLSTKEKIHYYLCKWITARKAHADFLAKKAENDVEAPTHDLKEDKRNIRFEPDLISQTTIIPNKESDAYRQEMARDEALSQKPIGVAGGRRRSRVRKTRRKRKSRRFK